MNQYEQLDQIQYMEHKWLCISLTSGLQVLVAASTYPSFGITLPSRRSHASASFCLYSWGFLTWHMTELSNTALGRLQPPRGRIALQAAEEYASCFRLVLVNESTQNPKIQPEAWKLRYLNPGTSWRFWSILRADYAWPMLPVHYCNPNRVSSWTLMS